MSLTSYRAAPPRAKFATKRVALTNSDQTIMVRKVTKLVTNTCGWKTRRRPTLPCLKTKYHRRYRLSRPSSEWDRVGHLCHNHLVIQTHVFMRFDRQASNKRAIPSKAKLRRHPKLECMLANRSALAFAFTHG